MRHHKLMLASVATLLPVTGVHAADVVAAEPVDYVRVCDVYGAGFLIIPGTETCIQVSGEIRFQVNVAGEPAVNREGDDYDANSSMRTRLNFDAREETELGTLRAFVRLQATNVGGSTQNVAMESAYLQIGGLLAGFRDSLWTSGIGGLEDGLLTDTDLVVGDFNTNQISYTFASSGFSTTIGLEDDGTGDVVPDVHGKLVYSGAWGGAFLSAVYDETFNEEDAITTFGFEPFDFGGQPTFPIFFSDLPTLLEDGSNDAFALKAGLSLIDLLVADSQIKLEGHWASDPTVYASLPGLATTRTFSGQTSTVINPTPGSVPVFLEWAAGAAYAQRFGRIGAAIAGQYGETFNTSFFTALADGTPAFLNVSGDYAAVVGNLGYSLTNNMSSLLEVSYRNVDFGESIGNTDQVGGFLRLQRVF